MANHKANSCYNYKYNTNNGQPTKPKYCIQSYMGRFHVNRQNYSY